MAFVTDETFGVITAPAGRWRVAFVPGEHLGCRCGQSGSQLLRSPLEEAGFTG